MISCMVEIEGAATKPRPPYRFISVPRIGERITPDSDGTDWREYRVIDLIHVPGGLQTTGGDELPAGVMLKVREIR